MKTFDLKWKCKAIWFYARNPINFLLALRYPVKNFGWLFRRYDSAKFLKTGVAVLTILLIACAGTGQSIMFERPKISVVSQAYQAAPWQTIGDVSELQTLAYFQFQGAYSYKVVYLTPFGKIPFKQKEISSGRTNDFWPNVLTDFKYEGDPSRLVFVAKDTVYAAPCYVKVQAWDGEKWSEWSELIKVE